MSNIAGKAFAMNLLTPIRKKTVWFNRLKFWALSKPIIRFFLKILFSISLDGLRTLSLIHYARWVILDAKQFPWLGGDQPKEKLHYCYMFFFSNFNGSWTQYVDSFSLAIPRGLDGLWYKNIGWPKAQPESMLNNYVLKNQIWTEHYFSAYPMASSNDIKSAQQVQIQLSILCENLDTVSEEAFLKNYQEALFALQADLSQMAPTPVVSLAHEAYKRRDRINKNNP
jgi:hypothetical protein